jgi:hypothetical protein
LAEESVTGGIEIVTSATRRGGDTVNAGRTLVRALVVLGGAAAVSAIAWLTATASASTVTQVTDGPIGSGSPAAVTTIGDPQPTVLSQVTGSVPVQHAHDSVTPALARVHDLPGAATHTGRLAEGLETSATQAVRAVPATVLAVGRIAMAATDLTGLVAPAAGPRDHVEKLHAGLDSAGPDDAMHPPANRGQRERSAGLSSAAIPVRAATTAIAGQPRPGHRSDHGAGGLAGHSWLPSCVVPASAGLTSGHDRPCGDAVQPPAAEHAQPAHRRNGPLLQAVTSAEIRPGVTPD